MGKKHKSAPYPRTSPAEIESRNVLMSLFDTRFVKGEIKTLDKVPNSDGILELTDADQYPLGKIDVQVKSLPIKYSSKPKYVCSDSFLAYCQASVLPVIIFVVDRKKKIAYWRHMDQTSVTNALEHMQGKSATIQIPIENCIDGRDLNYISSWTALAKDVAERVYNYATIKYQKEILEKTLTDLNQYLENPTKIPLATLRILHEFIDNYNYILDREFSAVKKILYPDFWKIGMGVSQLDRNHFSFVLYPVLFTKEQTLIKQIKLKSFNDLGGEFLNREILIAADWGSPDGLADEAKAYDFLKSDVLRVVTKRIFPIPDTFIAHEYLFSFCRMVERYFDLEFLDDSFSISDLKLKLFGIIPMMLGNKKGFADWVTEYDYDIDHDLSVSDRSKHRMRLAESHELLRSGAVPKVRVTVTSSRFDIQVIRYYIDYLIKNGHERIVAQYQSGAIKEIVIGLHNWLGWDKGVFWNNSQKFFQNFHRVKEIFITEHFAGLKHHLNILIEPELTIIYVLHWAAESTQRPYVEEFILRPGILTKGRILFFQADDPNCPVTRSVMHKKRTYDCQIDGVDYRVIRIRMQKVDFLLKDSPTYTMLNEIFSEQVRAYLESKERYSKKSPTHDQQA